MNGGFHAHDHDFMEIVLVAGGQGWHQSVHGEKQIGAGDAFILQPGAWHAYRGCVKLDYYNCCFGAEVLRRELAWVREDPVLNYLFWGGPLSLDRRGLVALHLPPEATGICRGHLDAIRQIEEDDPLHRRAGQVGRLLLFLGELARHMSAEYRRTAGPARRVHPAVLRGVDLLQADPAHPWTLGELAETLHIAPSHLVRLFKGVTGLPPLAYLARCRAERAAALLLRTDLPVGEIGGQVGWGDPNYFARRFKAYFGFSATAYREKFAQASGRGEAQR
jgi:AraC family L-rhamnose operon transcriptional activator RhaR